MKIFFVILLALSCFISACSDRLKSLNDTDIEVSVINGEEVVYSRTLKQNDVNYNLALAGNGDIKYIDIRASKSGVLLGKIMDEIEGIIFETLVTDLNENSKPEILILVRSGEPDNKLTIVGYEYSGKVFSRFDLPEPEDQHLFTSTGRDHIYIQGKNIFREFQTFNDSAKLVFNKTYRLVYSLDNKLQLNIVKQENY